MEFIDEKLSAYCEAHSEKESELLEELNRQTHLKVNQPRMLSGHLQGRFLSFLAALSQPKNILEIGTYTGYSALCLAEGLSENGKLTSIDNNEETQKFAQSFIDKSPFQQNIRLLKGNAMELIPKMNEKWDLVFIDADKVNYAHYFDLIIDKVEKGGLILADNVLWSGKILDEIKDKDTEAIHQFNLKIQGDKRVKSMILPVRDGISIMIKC
jgi:caffeoyl-CoA O-methyltransferase